MNLNKNLYNKKFETRTIEKETYLKNTLYYVPPYNQMTYRDKVGYSLVLETRKNETRQEK